MAVEKFSGVPNRGLPPVPNFDSQPFGPENQGVGTLIQELIMAVVDA